MCWNYLCLDPVLSGKEFIITVEANTTGPYSASPPGGSTVVITVLKPKCVTSAVVTSTTSSGQAITFSTLAAQTLPPSGISSLSVSADIGYDCNDQYMAMLMRIETAKVNDVQVVPPATCPCWSVPRSGVCSGIQLPIYLSTIPRANPFAPNSGVSYSQCIDPANFDPYTGRMAMSYCWRYACLPDAFSHANFNATITLNRWNIRRMPGNATFDTQLQLTKGVAIEVTGPPKVRGQPIVHFIGTAMANDRNYIGNVTLPPSGVGNFTFTWTVPVGMDDLSAAVVMDALAGPPPPAPPPAAPGTVCGCMPLPDTVTGLCPAGRSLALIDLAIPDANVPTYKECVPNAVYDVVVGYFAFSMCFKWRCLPSTFNKKPYVITVPNMTQYNVALMPPGVWQLRVNDLKPGLVNTTVWVSPTPGAPEPVCPASTQHGLGNWTYNLDVCVPALSSIGVQFSIPALPWIDGDSVAIEMHPGPTPPFPPQPPSPPPRPPHPSLPPAPIRATVIVASFIVLDKLGSQAQVDKLLAAQSAAISANLEGYILTLPLSFTDYTSVTDCSDASQQIFISDLAQLLSSSGLGFVVSPSQLSSTCALKFRAEEGNRRRSLLAADGPPPPLSACQGAVIGVNVQVPVPFFAAGNMAGLMSRIQGGVFNKYGNDKLCVKQFVENSMVSVEELIFTNTSAGRLRSRQLASDGVSSSQCLRLADQFKIDPSLQVNLSCTTITVDGRTYFTSPGAASSSDHDDSKKTGYIIGAVVGSVGLLAVAAVVLFAVNKRNNKRKANRISRAVEANVASGGFQFIEERQNERQDAAKGARALASAAGVRGHQTAAATSNVNRPAVADMKDSPNRNSRQALAAASAAADRTRSRGTILDETDHPPVMRDASFLVPLPPKKESSSAWGVTADQDVSESIRHVISPDLKAARGGFRGRSSNPGHLSASHSEDLAQAIERPGLSRMRSVRPSAGWAEEEDMSSAAALAGPSGPRVVEATQAGQGPASRAGSGGSEVGVAKEEGAGRSNAPTHESLAEAIGRMISAQKQP